MYMYIGEIDDVECKFFRWVEVADGSNTGLTSLVVTVSLSQTQRDLTNVLYSLCLK